MTVQKSSNEIEALHAFSDHRVDGMIIATRESEAGNEAILRLVDRRTPMVAVGREFVHDKVDRITCGYDLGGYGATCHLLSLGHHRIAFIGGALYNGAAPSRV